MREFKKFLFEVYMKKKLITQNDVDDLNKVLPHLKTKTLGNLLVTAPILLANLSGKTGAFLLFTANHLLNNVHLVSDDILRNLSSAELARYILRHNIPSIYSNLIPRKIAYQIMLKRDSIAKLLPPHASERPKRPLHAKSTIKKKKIDRERSQKKLKEEKDRYFNEGYTLDNDSIIQFIIDHNIKSITDSYKYNQYLNKYFTSMNRGTKKKNKIYQTLIDLNIWSSSSLKKVGQQTKLKLSIKAIADELLKQVKTTDQTRCPELRKINDKYGQFISSQKHTQMVKTYINLKIGLYKKLPDKFPYTKNNIQPFLDIFKLNRNDIDIKDLI